MTAKTKTTYATTHQGITYRRAARRNYSHAVWVRFTPDMLERTAGSSNNPMSVYFRQAGSEWGVIGWCGRCGDANKLANYWRDNFPEVVVVSAELQTASV